MFLRARRYEVKKFWKLFKILLIGETAMATGILGAILWVGQFSFHPHLDLLIKLGHQILRPDVLSDPDAMLFCFLVFYVPLFFMIPYFLAAFLLTNLLFLISIFQAERNIVDEFIEEANAEDELFNQAMEEFKRKV